MINKNGGAILDWEGREDIINGNKAENLLLIDKDEARLILEWFGEWLINKGYTSVPKNQYLEKAEKIEGLSTMLRDFIYYEENK